MTTTYGYDAASRLASLGHDLNGTAGDVTTTFGYNPAGQIASRTMSNDLYAWPGAVNVDRYYTPNALNQYTSAGAVSFGYDGRGNLTSSGSATYGYNAANQMVTAPSEVMVYDPAERLFYSQAEATLFRYDGAAMLTEQDSSTGAVRRRYVPGPGTDEPVVWYEGSGTSDKRWLLADERGSVVAVTNASGDAINVKSYDEFGIPSDTTPTNAGRFGYTGQAWLPTLGLSYYKARMYSPTLGRFMQTDPIGYGDGLNTYNYVGSDPINATDSSGLCAEGETYVTYTGSRIGECVAGATSANGGVLPSLSPGNSLSFGGGIGSRSGSGYIPATSGAPSTIGSNGDIIVRATLPGGSFSLPSSTIGSGNLFRLGLDGDQFQGDGSTSLQNISFGPCKPSALLTCTNPIDPRVYDNILRKHYFEPKSNKSVFNAWVLNPTAFMVAVGNVLENPYTTIAPGVRQYSGNVGWLVGSDRTTGKQSAIMTVIIQRNNSPDGFWSVANAYPGSP